MWSNSSKCRIILVYLTQMWCLYFIIIALDVVITLHFSINCLTVICSPTVLFAILREATSVTYVPRVYFPSYKFPIYYFAIFYFPIYKSKIQKYLLYHLFSFIYFYKISLLQVTMDWQPLLSCWVQVVWLFVQVLVICALSPTRFIHWFSNWGKYLSLLCCITRKNQRKLKK